MVHLYDNTTSPHICALHPLTARRERCCHDTGVETLHSDSSSRATRQRSYAQSQASVLTRSYKGSTQTSAPPAIARTRADGESSTQNTTRAEATARDRSRVFP